MSLAGLTMGVALAADPELALYRSQAALQSGDMNGAWEEAARALALAPEDWRAHLAWQEALASSPWWLDAEYSALAQKNDAEARLLAAWWAAQGGAPLDLPSADPALMAEVTARFSLDSGDPKTALAALGQLNTPEASKLRMEAFYELDDAAALRREGRDAQQKWPDRPDLLVWLVREDSLVGKPQRSRAVSAAASLVTASDPVLVYRAHALFLAAEQASLAEASAARLNALGEPYPLPSRALWKPAMIRDLGRVLSLQQRPELPPGGVPDESQRVLVATAATLEAKGRPERAAEVWRLALAADAPDCSTTMRAARALYEAGASSDDVLALVRQARTRCAIEADPGPSGAAARGELVDSWLFEAELLRRSGALPEATVAARTAVDLGAEAGALLLLGQLLEAQGEKRAALLVYAQASASGLAEADEPLRRLYGGPTDAEALVGAVASLSPELPRSQPEPQSALFPASVLRTDRGEVQVGGEGYVLVAFWASWCGPCAEELPDLDRWVGRLASENLPFTVVAVSVDDEEAQMARWLRNHSLSTLAVAWDPALGRQLALEGIPTTVLVGPGGEVIARHQGYAKGDIERLEGELREAFATTP